MACSLLGYDSRVIALLHELYIQTFGVCSVGCDRDHRVGGGRCGEGGRETRVSIKKCICEYKLLYIIERMQFEGIHIVATMK